MIHSLKKGQRWKFIWAIIVLSVCMIAAFLFQIYMFGNLLPTKQVPALFLETEAEQLLEVRFESPVKLDESYLNVMDSFGIKEAYFEWKTDYSIPIVDENLKVLAYRDNKGNGVIGKTTPADEHSGKGIIMPIEYQDDTITLDGITLDVVRRDQQSMDVAYMPMTTFLVLNPPIQSVGFYFQGASLQNNLEAIKKTVELQLPKGHLSYYAPDPNELQLAEREIFPKLCAGDFLILLVVCSIFYCVEKHFLLDIGCLRPRGASMRKRALLCMIQGDIYLWTMFLISAVIHAACYPVFDWYLNSVPNIKYTFGDYIIMLAMAFAGTAFLQLILFLPALWKHKPGLKEEGI